MRIGIIAALPGELKPLVRGWDRLKVAPKSGIQMWQRVRGEDDVIAVCAGMGAAAARRAFTAAEHAGALDAVLSVGWAGALSGRCETGAAYPIAEVVDTLTGERFFLESDESACRLVTTARVADADEKRRLRDAYAADLVDMEAATVARLAQMRGIPVRCLKAVSDEAGAALPDLNRFIDVQGKLRMPAFLAHVATRPQFWSALGRLGAQSAQAARAIAEWVEAALLQDVFGGGAAK
jgi:adenosylhomocysteine nucleosidase